MDRQTDMTVVNSRFSPNCTSEEGHEQTNVLLYHYSIGHVTWRPTYVLLLPGIWICIKALLSKLSIFNAHCDSDILLNKKHSVHSWFSAATVVVWRRHNVQLHVDCLFCLTVVTYHNFNVYYGKRNVPLCIVWNVFYYRPQLISSSICTVILTLKEYFLKCFMPLARGGVVVTALRYKPAGRGFDSRWCQDFSPLHNPAGRTMALGSTQPLTEMSTRFVSCHQECSLG